MFLAEARHSTQLDTRLSSTLEVTFQIAGTATGSARIGAVVGHIAACLAALTQERLVAPVHVDHVLKLSCVQGSAFLAGVDAALCDATCEDELASSIYPSSQP
jgi:NhaP-type Na+/H+ or K+/H+ antiporter